MEDVCRFGHTLIDGSDPIVITETDPETGRIVKSEKKLLRRHLVATGASRLDTTGLIAIGCTHGLKVRRDGNTVERDPVLAPDGAELPKRGNSWIRAKHARLQSFRSGKSLTFRAVCPVCLGEEPPEDLIVPADGSFAPLPEDLPEWAQ